MIVQEISMENINNIYIHYWLHFVLNENVIIIEKCIHLKFDFRNFSIGKRKETNFEIDFQCI